MSDPFGEGDAFRPERELPRDSLGHIRYDAPAEEEEDGVVVEEEVEVEEDEVVEEEEEEAVLERPDTRIFNSEMKT